MMRDMTIFARSTEALSRLDTPLNAMTDVTVRRMPWMWWPATPPRQDRPYSVAQHAATLAWSAATFVVGELATPRQLRSSGRRLQLERAGSLLLSIVAWVLAAGAWDRRAERLRRRPWRRLLRGRTRRPRPS
jgi:hypothetical protein